LEKNAAGTQLHQSKGEQMGYMSSYGPRLLHRCWFPCKTSLSAGGRWAFSLLPLLGRLAFPAGVFALPSNQQLEALYTVTYVNNHQKKSERVGFL